MSCHVKENSNVDCMNIRGEFSWSAAAKSLTFGICGIEEKNNATIFPKSFSDHTSISDHFNFINIHRLKPASFDPTSHCHFTYFGILIVAIHVSMNPIFPVRFFHRPRHFRYHSSGLGRLITFHFPGTLRPPSSRSETNPFRGTCFVHIQYHGSCGPQGSVSFFPSVARNP